ncbi:MAG TPA: DUF1800 domain-containing protein [Gemmatales bacterium]|nr:DUF1800 domain-containing protein [Gemmatales bacterium]
MFLGHYLAIDPVWAWSAYEPDPKSPWTIEKAGHLYRRAAWGANWTELQTALKQGPRASIDQLLTGGTGLEAFHQKAARLAEPLAQGTDDQRLRAWWLYVILNSPHPLEERLTLLWHNHFATSNAKVQNIGSMYRQNELLRRHALGNFDKLLHDVSEDSAMLVWLDTVANKKGKPNENYARELMELFSLGVGNYNETDIRQAARAFTGWGIKSDRYHFNPDEHDDGQKTVMGKTSTFGGHDIVKLCLDHPACARFVVRKLFRYFISETLQPDDALIEPLAARFRENHYDIKQLVSIILRSNLFFSPEVYRAKVKAPVEFAVTLVHMLEGRVDSIQLADLLDPLGQRLFAPPSVKGWDGGPNWLNSTTMLLRHNLCLALTSTEDRRFYNRCDPAQLTRKHMNVADPTLDQTTQFLADLFLQGDIPTTTHSKFVARCTQLKQQKYAAYWSQDFIKDYQTRAIAHLILTLPEFQLA